MRYVRLGVLAGSLAAMVCLALTGCGVIDRDVEPLPRQPKKKGTGGSVEPVIKLDPFAGADGQPVKPDAYVGVIKGMVKWEGKSEFGDLTTALLAQMNGNTTDKPHCVDSASEFEKSQQSLRVGKNNGLGNVFVWIAPPGGQYFEVPDRWMPKSRQVVVSQPHCTFLPHCSTVFATRYKNGLADPKGCQVLVVQNDARVGHNAKVVGGPLNGGTDRGIPAWDGTGPIRREEFRLRPESNQITISCGVHGWMTAYVRVFDHPYNDVTKVGLDRTDPKKVVWDNPEDKDYGTFRIEGAPVGATVTLYAWHEKLGHLLGPNGKEITIDKDEAKNEQTIAAKGN